MPERNLKDDSAGSPDLLDVVDGRWGRLCEANPAYFDGRLYHVLGVHRNGYGGAVLHVIDCAYRFHAVQDASFDLGVRSLGVKGITRREGRVLMGLRSPHVNAYRGLWEFAPGGVVELGAQPSETVVQELKEETGLAIQREPKPIAVLYDEILRCWEIVFEIVPAPGNGSGEPQAEPQEYDELKWCEPHALPGNLTPIARQMVRLLSSNQA